MNNLLRKIYLRPKLFLVVFVFMVFQTLSFAQQEAITTSGKKVLLFENGTWIFADSTQLHNINTAKIIGLEIPKTNPKDEVINHTGFSLLFNKKHNQANWVAYELTKDETNKLYDRTDKFIADPKVKTITAFNLDYKSSGYDRGHLAPASDMGWSQTTMTESFYYSNMSPQVPSFNRGIWKKLEEQVRDWAIENKSIYVVTGPVLTNELEHIGANKISVPKYYYKVILDYTQPNIKGIGFILPNEASKEQLQHFVVTIDSVEKFTGLDFFPLLKDDQEEVIESMNCIKCWSWDSLNLELQKTETGEPNTLEASPKTIQTKPTKVQCSGTTNLGIRCKRITSNTNGRCAQH